MKNVSARTCCFISPFRDPQSAERQQTDRLLDYVLRPALRSLGLQVFCAHRSVLIEPISREIIQHLLRDRLVVANLTGQNPNVMYELGVRHATGKPVILIALEGTKVPFYSQDQRVIFFKDDLGAADQLRNQMRIFGKHALTMKSHANPVTLVAREDQIVEAAKRPDALRFVMEQLNSVWSQVQQIHEAVAPPSKPAEMTERLARMPGENYFRRLARHPFKVRVSTFEEKVMKLFFSKKSIREIARELGASESTIFNILGPVLAGQ